MSKIPPEVLDEIRNNSSITQVIGHYIPLHKKGRSFTAVCPFHNDHDPSLSISEEKQIYKCFVCGSGGNVFSFVRNFKKIEFEESVVEVAQISGYPLNFSIQKKEAPKHKYQRYFDLMQQAIEYSNYILHAEKAKHALEYLISRGIEQETIDYFQIGFNPPHNELRDYLLKKNFKDEELLETNLARMTDKGISDVFYNRILFPIHDAQGHAIAFSARAMQKNDAKYINTSETKIYTKGDVLYNLNRAKEDIKQKSRVFILEGVIDVIAMYRAGYKNCVSSLGTSFTTKQLELLKKYCSTIVLNFDGDRAGKDATIKAGKLALKHGFEVFVVRNETNKDPDEIIQSMGKNSLRSVVDNQYSLIEFAMSYFDNGLETYAERKEYAENVGSLIDLLDNPEDRINFSLLLKEKTNIIRNIKSSDKIAQIGYNKKTYQQSSVTGVVYAEYAILNQMMHSPKAVEMYKKHLAYLNDKNHIKIVNQIIDQYRRYGNFSHARFMDENHDDSLSTILLSIASDEAFDNQYNEALFLDCVNVVKKETMKLQREQLQQKLNEAKHIGEEELKKVLQEISELNRKLGGKHGKNS